MCGHLKHGRGNSLIARRLSRTTQSRPIPIPLAPFTPWTRESNKRKITSQPQSSIRVYNKLFDFVTNRFLLNYH